MSDWLDATHVGDCRRLMRRMIADGVRVQSIVTSPPYWGLRDYEVAGQFGLEPTWMAHVARMRTVFRLARDLLRPDGTLWLNYGDSYAGSAGGYQGKNGQRASRTHTARIRINKRGRGVKPKDLMGMPWRVALALQGDGWWLRSDIIWSKTNPMPESVKDRPTRSHEYLFLLARRRKYFYDASAIAEPASENSHSRGSGVHRKANFPSGWDGANGDHKGKRGRYVRQNASFSAAVKDVVDTRNVRTVWTINTEKFPGAHFATFPQELVKRCILASTKPGDVVFDPFMGAGTVGLVATSLGRRFIGCELSAKYIALHGLRKTTTGLALE